MSPRGCRRIALLVLSLGASFAMAKDDGITYIIEGRVAGVRAEGGVGALAISGRFLLVQYANGGRGPRQQIQFDCGAGVAAAFTFGPVLHAESSDGRDAAARDERYFIVAMRRAASRGTVVRLTLERPLLDLTRNSCPLVGAQVTRFTDIAMKEIP